MNSMLIAIALIVAAPAPKEAAKTEPEIVGVWKVTGAVKGGQPSDVPVGTTIEFTAAGTMHLNERGKNTAGDTTYKIDSSKNPPHLDLITPVLKGGTPNMQIGIYKIEKNTLTICLTFVEKRPTQFESAKNSGLILLTLERNKQD